MADKFVERLADFHDAVDQLKVVEDKNEIFGRPRHQLVYASGDERGRLNASTGSKHRLQGLGEPAPPAIEGFGHIRVKRDHVAITATEAIPDQRQARFGQGVCDEGGFAVTGCRIDEREAAFGRLTQQRRQPFAREGIPPYQRRMKFSEDDRNGVGHSASGWSQTVHGRTICH
ncbi:MAG: hypothetical protein AAB382_12170 [Chloroflexota bacterium]